MRTEDETDVEKHPWDRHHGRGDWPGAPVDAEYPVDRIRNEGHERDDQDEESTEEQRLSGIKEDVPRESDEHGDGEPDEDAPSYQFPRSAGLEGDSGVVSCGHAWLLHRP